MSYEGTPFDKRQFKVTVQIDKDILNLNNLTPKSNLKTNHKKEPIEYPCETVVNKSRTFFDHLQNPTGNKIHEKVAQSIDSFIDELVEVEESSFASQTRTSVNLTLALQQEVNSRNLPTITLMRFDGNPSKWPEFVENVFTGVHSKQAFDNT